MYFYYVCLQYLYPLITTRQERILSLKAFHIIFIALSTLLAFGFAGWCGYFYANYGETLNLIMGIISFVTGIVLIIYGKRFLQKLKHVNYM